MLKLYILANVFIKYYQLFSLLKIEYSHLIDESSKEMHYRLQCLLYWNFSFYTCPQGQERA